jgi:hypothetical protein
MPDSALVIAILGLIALIAIVYNLRTEQRVISAPPRVPRPPVPAQPGTAPILSNGRTGSRVLYRTRDGRADYGFSIEQQPDGTWRTYIVSQPGYGNRASDAHSTHRLTDGDRKYVCWDSPLRTLAQAKQVAGLWADATQEYIRTGKKF